MKHLLIKCIVASVVCLAMGGLSGVVTADAIPTWYATIQKPSFNPPSWVFGPVWTTLYILMGIAFGVIWDSDSSHPMKRKAMGIFGIQLLLNALWSILFFGLQNPFAAFIEIIVLQIFILLTILYFYRIKAWTIWLLVPYLLWVGFASVLNYSIYILN